MCIDLLKGTDELPGADMVIANPLVEYIGYECFQDVIRQVMLPNGKKFVQIIDMKAISETESQRSSAAL